MNLLKNSVSRTLRQTSLRRIPRVLGRVEDRCRLLQVQRFMLSGQSPYHTLSTRIAVSLENKQKKGLDLLMRELDSLLVQKSSEKQYEDVIELYIIKIKALQKLLPSGHRGVLGTMQLLAENFIAANKYEEAIKVLNQVRDMEDQEDLLQTPGHISTLVTLSLPLKVLGRNQEAKEVLTEACQVAERIEGKKNQLGFIAKMQLSLVLQKMGNLQECLKLDRQVCNFLLETNDLEYVSREEKSIMFFNWAQSEYKHGNHKTAMQAVQEGWNALGQYQDDRFGYFYTGLQKYEKMNELATMLAHLDSILAQVSKFNKLVLLNKKLTWAVESDMTEESMVQICQQFHVICKELEKEGQLDDRLVMQHVEIITELDKKRSADN